MTHRSNFGLPYRIMDLSLYIQELSRIAESAPSLALRLFGQRQLERVRQELHDEGYPLDGLNFPDVTLDLGAGNAA